MKTPNPSKVAAGEKRGASEVITPKLDSLCNDAGMSGIMTRSRLKQLCDSTGKLYGASEKSANMRRALLRCFEDLPGTASLESTCPSNKKSQKDTLLEAESVTPSDNDSIIRESQSLRIERSLKSDNDNEQDCTNTHKSVSVALYNASEVESPYVTVTVSGLCDNIKAAIMIHDVKKGSKEVCDTDFKVNSSLLETNDDELSPNHSKKERKAIKARKKSRSSLNKNEWTVTDVSEHVTECGNGSDVVKFPQESDEVSLRNTELTNGPSVSFTNDELSPNNSQKESQISKSRNSKSPPPPNKNGSAVPTAQEHITEFENEMCKVKSPQKFNRCKNMWNPAVRISPLAAEFEERMQSGSIRCGETPLRNPTDLESHTESEVNTPLSGLEPLDRPLIQSNKGEPSPEYSTTEKKAQKSRKGNSSLLKGNEKAVTTVSEHITAFENEIGVVKSYQGSDKCSLKSTEPQDGPSLTSNGDESSPSNSHKESKLKNSKKSKSSLPNKNEWTISKVPEGTTELGNEMSETKIPQKFDKCKNGGNPIMTISQLPAEIEFPKSVVIRERETQLKNLSDTESALADKARGVNNTSDSDSETRQVEGSHNAKSSPLRKSKQTKKVRSESSESDSDAESRKAIMESAQRRIIQNISTSESESKKYVRPHTVSTGSDTSDSVPEAMSFSAGRQLVMESWQNAADSIQREKHRRKEKRKERLEKYKQQKEEKLIRLKEKRASQEDASCSSSEESGYEEVDVPSVLEKSNRKANVKWKKENPDDLSQSKGKRFHSGDEGEPEGKKAKKRKNEQKDPSQHCGNLRKLPDDVLQNLPDQVPMKLQKTDSAATSEGKRSHKKHAEDKRQEHKKRRDIDYIPLSTCGATEFGVMPLDKFMRAPKSMAECAAEFRQNMLFGTRIRRGPANAQTVYQHKLKASGKGRFLR